MKTWPVAFLITMFVGCSPVRIVGTKQTEDFRLSSYKTFGYYNVDVSGEEVPMFDQRVQLIKDEISRRLTSVGLAETTSDPDLLVNIGIVVEEKIQTRETNYMDAPRYMGQRNYHWESQDVEVNRYHEGTVTIDFVDAAKSSLVWQGVTSSVMARRIEESKKNVARGAEKLFETIPK